MGGNLNTIVGITESKISLEEITDGRLTGEIVRGVIGKIFFGSSLYPKLPESQRAEFIENITGLVAKAAEVDPGIQQGRWNSVNLGMVVQRLIDEGTLPGTIQALKDNYPDVSFRVIAKIIPSVFIKTMRVLANGQDLHTFQVRQRLVRNGTPTMLDLVQGREFHSTHHGVTRDESL